MKTCVADFPRVPFLSISLLFVIFLAAGGNASGRDAKLKAAEATIQKSIAASGADVAVYFKTLDGMAEWSTHPDAVFHAASTMKVPVMIELFHQIKQGKLQLTDKVVVKNEFHSIVDGSLYKLRPDDDSEADLYK